MAQRVHCRLHIIVTILKGPTTIDFKGFMIQARAPNGNTPQGTFISPSPDAQVLNCTNPNVLHGAVSHTSRSMKPTISVIWIPPKPATTDIQFRATVVQNVSTFWINVLSDVLPLADAGAQLLAPTISHLLLCSFGLLYVLFTL
ncbi:putative defense protein Hdd11 isoform X2 [Dendropsophus ebraccatus]|uniref:putative defense protein Hdd11 isoform X2 n=1 Tax=Dendropsophus ebraccatus TaxID=150705 RepID=UPI0038310E02